MLSAPSIVHPYLIEEINLTTGLIIGVGAAIATIATAYKVLWYGKKDAAGNRRPGLLRGILLDIRGFRDAILGREPVVDSITGEQIAPRLPDIGTRMATQERQMATLTEAVIEMAKAHRRIDDLESRVVALEHVSVERTLSKAEMIQLYKTMETAINSDPTPREHDHEATQALRPDHPRREAGRLVDQGSDPEG